MSVPSHTKLGAESAFARPSVALPNDNWEWGAPGLTKREYAAIRIATAIATTTSNGWAGKNDGAQIAIVSVAIADALMGYLSETEEVAP